MQAPELNPAVRSCVYNGRSAESCRQLPDAYCYAANYALPNRETAEVCTNTFIAVFHKFRKLSGT